MSKEKNVDFRTLIKHSGEKYGHWSSIEVNGIRMSIQAGDGKYSCPREDFLNVSQYTEWEVAFINKEGDFCEPFPVEIVLGHGFLSDQVLPYVEVENVQKMYEALLMVEKLEKFYGVKLKSKALTRPWSDEDEDDCEDCQSDVMETCSGASMPVDDCDVEE